MRPAVPTATQCCSKHVFDVRTAGTIETRKSNILLSETRRIPPVDHHRGKSNIPIQRSADKQANDGEWRHADPGAELPRPARYSPALRGSRAEAPPASRQHRQSQPDDGYEVYQCKSTRQHQHQSCEQQERQRSRCEGKANCAARYLPCPRYVTTLHVQLLHGWRRRRMVAARSQSIQTSSIYCTCW